ncbi:hypothetical protein [Ruminococcus sp. HUN007]|uniref:hypothetical protein n=1 Tax=Ruminococcus sp. HUN007 TaxID=1514668 RepID=UPI0005D13ADD|nr:hypothetical protein [Ruminococcus sp. HUN007]
MNAEQLRDAIGKIDDRFIEEAEHYEPEIKSRKLIWIITSASAAVIALCTCVHFHNATEHALRPEIDNSVVITTSVSETETYETDVVKTEKHVQISEPVTENTEATGMKSGEESSIPYEVTVPEKTEATSENVGSLGEKNVPDLKPPEMTDITAIEPREVTREVQTVAPVTEPTVFPLTDVSTVTPVSIETVPVPVPSQTSYPSPSPKSTSSPVSTSAPPAEVTDITSLSEPSVSQTGSHIHNHSKEDFPVYLKTSDGVKYERNLLITKGHAGKFIKNIFLSDDEGNDYEVSEYSLRYDVSEYPLKSVSDDQVSIFYFKSEDEYLIYVKETENDS